MYTPGIHNDIAKVALDDPKVTIEFNAGDISITNSKRSHHPKETRLSLKVIKLNTREMT